MAVLLSSSVKSWLKRNFNGFTINPKITNQQDLHPGSCTHHSFVSIVESAHKIHWHKKKDRAKRNLEIDILWLLKEFPPPITMRDLISGLNSKGKGNGNGTIKATNGSFSFKIVDYEYLLVGFGEPETKDNLERVHEYIEENGPVLESFYHSPSYKLSRTHDVYVSDHVRQTITCPECKRPLDLKHAVCVVGIATACVNQIYKPCFIYIERENPKENSKEGDGICCMTVDSMHSITLPVLR